MTVADSPFAQGRNPRFDLIATRLAHWTWTLFVIAGLLPLLGTLADYVFGIWPSYLWVSVLILGLTIILSGVLVTAIAVTAWHVYALCPVCARKTPLDPKSAVAKKRRPLRTYHWIADKHHKALNRTLIVLLVLSFVPWVSYAAWPMVMALLGLLSYLGDVHMPLQPWCPQCRWDDGGGKERVPQPDPTGEAVR